MNELNNKLNELLVEREKLLFKISLSEQEIEMWKNKARQLIAKDGVVQSLDILNNSFTESLKHYQKIKEEKDALEEWKTIILKQMALNKKRLKFVEEEIVKLKSLLTEMEDKKRK